MATAGKVFGGEAAAGGIVGGEGVGAIGLALGEAAGPLIAAAIVTALIADVLPKSYKQQLNQTASGASSGANVVGDIARGHYATARHDTASFLDGLLDVLPGLHFGESGAGKKGKLTVNIKKTVKAR